MFEVFKQDSTFNTDIIQIHVYNKRVIASEFKTYFVGLFPFVEFCLRIHKQLWAKNSFPQRCNTSDPFTIHFHIVYIQLGGFMMFEYCSTTYKCMLIFALYV